MKRIDFKTPYDYSASHFSGYTRAHYEEIFSELMAAIIDNGSPGCARQLIPGPRSHHGRLADELEGFTRSFIMAGPWLSQQSEPGFDLRGRHYEVADFYRRGIVNGTNPQHPEYWGDITDYAQHLVEMASLAWGLYQSRTHIWDQFSPAEQQQVGGYLYQCTQAEYHQNNWLLFNVVTNGVLKKLGMPYSQEQIDRNIAACEHMYIGEGWYRDGDINRIDYYNAWAFHYYYLIYTILEGDEHPELAETHKRRVREFGRILRYFISSDGSAPCYGRSMIYRFGYLAPLSLGYSLGALDIPVGELRTMFNMTLKFFFSREILTDQGHLSMGFLRPAEGVLEHYNCGGSPYWAVKALNILMLPPEDPFWSVPEEPLPIHTNSFSIPLKSAGILVLGDQHSGHVQLINHKSYHDKDEYNAKYTNFSYSSIFTYDSRAVYGSFNSDSSLQWSEDGIFFHQRWEMTNLYCEKDFAAAHYPLHKADPEGEVTTWTLVKDGLLVHIHQVHTTKPGLRFRQGGYPLGFDSGRPVCSSSGTAEIARIDDRYSLLAGLNGFSRQVPAGPFQGQLNGVNTRYVQSICSRLDYQSPAAGSFLLSAAVYANRGSETDQQLSASVPSFRQQGSFVRLVFHDGEEAALNIGEPSTLDFQVGGLTIQGRPRVLRVKSGEVTSRVEY
ncbi:MAG TPA: DUF2264 domain-containing protein [Clostridia bacterium]|nr:DUF2264 domain-containing protein [Clostridia bacterium]